MIFPLPPHPELHTHSVHHLRKKYSSHSGRDFKLSQYNLSTLVSRVKGQEKAPEGRKDCRRRAGELRGTIGVANGVTQSNWGQLKQLGLAGDMGCRAR